MACARRNAAHRAFHQKNHWPRIDHVLTSMITADHGAPFPHVRSILSHYRRWLKGRARIVCRYVLVPLGILSMGGFFLVIAPWSRYQSWTVTIGSWHDMSISTQGTVEWPIRLWGANLLDCREKGQEEGEEQQHGYRPGPGDAQARAAMRLLNSNGNEGLAYCPPQVAAPSQPPPSHHTSREMSKGEPESGKN